MEGKKQVGSSSSFTSDLFGAKESPPSSSSSGIFASIFPPPSTAVNRNSSSTEAIGYWQKKPSDNQVWHNKQGTSEKNGKNSNIASNSPPRKGQSSIFQEDRAEPCYLSSSLYYGGQDIYSHSPSGQDSGSNPIYKKEGGEDDPNGNNSHSASRGNWWQGSLYY